MLALQKAALLQEKTSKKDKKRKQPEPDHDAAVLQTWQVFDEAELLDAHQLIADETAFVQEAMGHSDTTEEEYREAWATAVRDFIYLPMQHKYGRAASATNTDRLDSVRGEYHAALDQMKREAERAAKLESKVALVTGGLVSREVKLNEQILHLTERAQAAASDVVSFQSLSAREQHAGPSRRAAAHALVQKQQERERKLQQKYKDLLDKRDALQSIKIAATA